MAEKKDEKTDLELIKEGLEEARVLLQGMGLAPSVREIIELYRLKVEGSYHNQMLTQMAHLNHRLADLHYLFRQRMP